MQYRSTMGGGGRAADSAPAAVAAVDMHVSLKQCAGDLSCLYARPCGSEATCAVRIDGTN